MGKWSGRRKRGGMHGCTSKTSDYALPGAFQHPAFSNKGSSLSSPPEVIYIGRRDIGWDDRFILPQRPERSLGARGRGLERADRNDASCPQLLKSIWGVWPIRDPKQAQSSPEIALTYDPGGPDAAMGKSDGCLNCAGGTTACRICFWSQKLNTGDQDQVQLQW